MKFGFLSSKIYFFCCLIILLFFIWQAWQEKNRNISPEIQVLQEKLKQEQAEYAKLIDSNQYLSTEIYLERQARQKFKLQKPDEKIMIIQESEKQTIEHSESKQELSNFVKWWYYLLKR